MSHRRAGARSSDRSSPSLKFVFVCRLCAEILEGGVKIIQNKYLSFASQINWLDIVKDGTADIMIEDNGPQSESVNVTEMRLISPMSIHSSVTQSS